MEPTRTTTILIVDDEPDIVALVRNMLWKEGYNVLEASSVEEALQVAAEYSQPIQLLLTDIVMGESNGFKLAAEIKSRRPETKVLFMSGYLDRVIFQTTGASVEGAPLIRKPFTRYGLALKVNEVLEAEQPQD